MPLADELQEVLFQASGTSQQGRVIVASDEEREHLHARVSENCVQFFRRLAEWRQQSMSVKARF